MVLFKLPSAMQAFPVSTGIKTFSKQRIGITSSLESIQYPVLIQSCGRANQENKLTTDVH